MSLRTRLNDGAVIGTFSNIPNPVAAEILALAGFEVVCLDGEHGIFDLTEFGEGIRAVEAAHALPLVRVPEVGVLISQVLDMGAAGILVPRIASAEEARAVVDFARYPPLGRRGFGYGRNTSYGARMTDDLAEVNRGVYVILQIESVAGVEALEAICAVPGIDMICVGPYDLAVSMGEEMWSAAHAREITNVLEYAKGIDLATGVFCTTADQVERFAGMGVTLFLIDSDVTLMARQAMATHRSAVTAAGTSTPPAAAMLQA